MNRPIYPGRNPHQCMSANIPWFKLDLSLQETSETYEEVLMMGSAIDAPEFLPSGGTTAQGQPPFHIFVREMPREG